MESEITPQSRFRIGLGELWEFRELFYFFTVRDIKVKYKQTVFGILWAIVQPLLMCLLFTFFLGKAITGYAALDLPYDVFALSGLVLWSIFGNGLSNAGNSMVVNAGIIRKIYFPRLIIPLSAVLVALFDFFMALVVLIVFCLLRGQAISLMAFLYGPAAVLITTLSTFGLGTWLAALNVKYRDFRYVIPFLVQVLLFASPVIYPSTLASQGWIKTLLMLNPMTGALALFRSSLTGVHPETTVVLCGLTVALVLLIAGIYYFRKTEAYFADLA